VPKSVIAQGICVVGIKVCALVSMGSRRLCSKKLCSRNMRGGHKGLCSSEYGLKKVVFKEVVLKGYAWWA
jgi:hypothetical protein